ncbi:hypothetical protein KQX54_020669 [Cotesia glomerata]|uniref:Uncharacterized protein n=1 Tax=Cotesia glomerata TaxID=32391 RepID=A0AAV7I1P9_COTGL|nr:hypothetical protein KQX54_020669 [Cotesia glomerata]
MERVCLRSICTRVQAQPSDSQMPIIFGISNRNRQFSVTRKETRRPNRFSPLRERMHRLSEHSALQLLNCMRVPVLGWLSLALCEGWLWFLLASPISSGFGFNPGVGLSPEDLPAPDCPYSTCVVAQDPGCRVLSSCRPALPPVDGEYMSVGQNPEPRTMLQLMRILSTIILGVMGLHCQN